MRRYIGYADQPIKLDWHARVPVKLDLPCSDPARAAAARAQRRDQARGAGGEAWETLNPTPDARARQKLGSAHALGGEVGGAPRAARRRLRRACHAVRAANGSAAASCGSGAQRPVAQRRTPHRGEAPTIVFRPASCEAGQAGVGGRSTSCERLAGLRQMSSWCTATSSAYDPCPGGSGQRFAVRGLRPEICGQSTCRSPVPPWDRRPADGGRAGGGCFAVCRGADARHHTGPLRLCCALVMQGASKGHAGAAGASAARARGRGTSRGGAPTGRRGKRRRRLPGQQRTRAR